ncbi:MAG: rhodanese-like domain-containing protein [Zoogloea sp.]|uniref:rhodanese-like domain-containing protein n=1 Tax=Zoogloea sp. TaxID=49181 RepID=UPI00262DB70E|nr:rhodanese-like domain-containing protein [Zoogloea sp.]MDD2988738.1 rhodanese-like domain-containing protein [Zoogloea sp.]
MEFIQQNWYWAALAAVSGSLLIVTSLKGGRGISPAQATTLINREDAIVVDVRESAEYSAGHLLNARHIPLGELEKRLGELDKFKDKPVILNCQSGSRSASACGVLRKAGFNNVHNLEGGIAAWEQAGMPISRRKK